MLAEYDEGILSRDSNLKRANKRLIQYIIIIRIVPIVKRVIKTLRFVRFIRTKDFTVWNCFCSNELYEFLTEWGTTSANLLRHRHLLAQLQTKLRVTCRRHQIYAIFDETSQPWQMVRPSLTLWGIYHSPVSGQPLSHRGWKWGIGIIAAAINIIKLEYNDWIWYILLNKSNER